MLEQLTEWLTNPRLVAVLALGVAFYILRDIVRAFLYILDSSSFSLKRRKKRPSPESPRPETGKEK